MGQDDILIRSKLIQSKALNREVGGSEPLYLGNPFFFLNDFFFIASNFFYLMTSGKMAITRTKMYVTLGKSVSTVC